MADDGRCVACGIQNTTLLVCLNRWRGVVVAGGVRTADLPSLPPSHLFPHIRSLPLDSVSSLLPTSQQQFLKQEGG